MSQAATCSLMGVAGMSQAAACSLSFYLVAKAPFFASQKNVKTLIDGRCGHGKRAPAECSDGGGKKQSHPAEGVADSLDEAQGESSPYQKMSWCQKLPKAISG